MSRQSVRKSLLYIVNRVSADDTQHFVHIPNLLQKLRTLGWEVELVSERGGEGWGSIGEISVRFLSREGRWSRLWNLAKELLRARQQDNRLVFVRISTSSAFVSSLLGRVFGWKTVYWLSGTNEDFNIREKGWRGRLDFILLWILFRLIDKLATGPETMRDYYCKLYHLKPEKVVVLYNDIDLNPATKVLREAREAHRLERVLMVHRLSPMRDTMNWFPAILRRLEGRRLSGREVQFDVVGGGPELPILRAEASKYPELSINFHGSVANRLLAKFYGRADLFIMPSRREGFPRVCLEAMARGLPIVAAAAGGTRDLFGDMQQRYIVPLDETDEFSLRITELLDDPGLRQALGDENLERVTLFSTEAVAKMYDERLGKLLR